MKKTYCDICGAEIPMDDSPIVACEIAALMIVKAKIHDVCDDCIISANKVDWPYAIACIIRENIRENNEKIPDSIPY